MAEFIASLLNGASGREIAMSDETAVLTRSDALRRVSAFASSLGSAPSVIGLMGSDGIDLAVAQLAAWTAGKTVVPLPSFFGRAQIEHVLRDAGIKHVIATCDAVTSARELGVEVTAVTDGAGAAAPTLTRGGGCIVYTSGSTGRPKGVRLGLEQIDWQARALAAAIGATSEDAHVSVLPLSLLLETIAAICVPALVGARTHFASTVSASLARGEPHGLIEVIEAVKPSTTVLVPQVLTSWVAQLQALGRAAPDSLRVVAVGGAPVSPTLAEAAWSLGIPVHEGYGLTECCSVVAMNRPGRRKGGTVGEPIPGLDIRIDDGEIVVSGPTVMEGYLNGGAAPRPWRTGDLGELDADGYLRVTGRKDNLIVMASGRNVSPEWVEAFISSDPRVACCALLGYAEEALSVFLIPSVLGESWFTKASRADVLLWLERRCAPAPHYARPTDFTVCSLDEAKRLGLLTANGRIVRKEASRVHSDRRGAPRLEMARQH